MTEPTVETPPVPADAALEHQAMDLTRWANLAMGIVGALAAWASNSQALLIDGLFSLIGYGAAVAAMRVSRTVHLGPDRYRPFGYGAHEALYTTFRSLALLGLVAFGCAQAGIGIANYLLGGTVETVRLLPVAIYTAFVATACFVLAVVHWRAWTRSGGRSHILRLEMAAAIYDGLITLFAGIGLLATPYLATTALAPLTPVMDSILVLLLCGIAILSYLRDFRKGLAQLAGAPADANDQLLLRRIARQVAGTDGGRMLDVAVIRLGRRLDAVIYYNPGRPVTADQIDSLTERLTTAAEAALGPTSILVVVSTAGRETPLPRPDEDLPAEP